MTKFEVGDRVEITDHPESDYNGFCGKVLSPPNEFNHIELALESVPVGHSEEWQTGNFYVLPHEITLAKQETEVTEFKAGDVVRMVRSRNAFGADGYGYPIGSLQELVSIDNSIINQNGWVAWEVLDGGWVRSDDIELVSRKAEPLTAEFTSDMIDWEEILFGNHETEGSEARYKIARIDDAFVSLKIKKDIWWTSDDLIELGSHILALAEYLETGTVDLSDDCIECENEHLRDSNERLASANEAKRQRLAKIRELTEV